MSSYPTAVTQLTINCHWITQLSSNCHHSTAGHPLSSLNCHPITITQLSSNSHHSTVIQLSSLNCHRILITQLSSNSHHSTAIQHSSLKSHPYLTRAFFKADFNWKRPSLKLVPEILFPLFITKIFLSNSDWHCSIVFSFKFFAFDNSPLACYLTLTVLYPLNYFTCMQYLVFCINYFTCYSILLSTQDYSFS